MAKCAWQKTRINGVDCLIPFDRDSEKKLADFILNEPVTGDISGARNPRSLAQLRLYWAACSLVAENHSNLTTKDDVDWWIRNILRFYDHDKTYVNGPNVCFKVRSISFKNLKHIEACDYFNRAFDWMAEELGILRQVGQDDFEVDRDKFINEVKMRIGMAV